MYTICFKSFRQITTSSFVNFFYRYCLGIFNSVTHRNAVSGNSRIHECTGTCYHRYLFVHICLFSLLPYHPDATHDLFGYRDDLNGPMLLLDRRPCRFYTLLFLPRIIHRTDYFLGNKLFSHPLHFVCGIDRVDRAGVLLS